MTSAPGGMDGWMVDEQETLSPWVLPVP